MGGANAGVQAHRAAPLQLRLQHMGGARGQLLARAVFGAHHGQIVVPAPGGRQRPGQARFQPAHGGAFDVDVLIGAAYALRAHHLDADEVLDAVVKGHAAQRQRAALPVRAQLERARSLGPHGAVAQEGVRAFGAHVIGRDLLERGRLKCLAVAALDDQLGRGLPHQIGAGADFGAEDFMPIQPRAHGGHQIGSQADFVLRKQGLVRGAVAPAGQAGVDQRFLAPLRARAELVAAQAPLHKAVAHAVAQVLRAGGADAVVALVDHAQGAVIGAQLRLDAGGKFAAPLRITVAAIDGVAVVVMHIAARGNIVVFAVFAALLPARFDLLARAQQIARRDAAGSGAAAFDLAQAAVFAAQHIAHLPLLARQAHQQAFGHRPAREEGQLAARAAQIAIGGRLPGESDRAFPLARGPARNDVDHAAQRLGAIQGRERAANDFHPIHGRKRHPAVLVIGVADHVVRGGNAPPVNQHQRVRVIHAAQRKRLAPADLAGREHQAGRVFNHRQQVIAGLGLFLHALAVMHRD